MNNLWFYHWGCWSVPRTFLMSSMSCTRDCLCALIPSLFTSTAHRHLLVPCLCQLMALEAASTHSFLVTQSILSQSHVHRASESWALHLFNFTGHGQAALQRSWINLQSYQGSMRVSFPLTSSPTSETTKLFFLIVQSEWGAFMTL